MVGEISCSGSITPASTPGGRLCHAFAKGQYSRLANVVWPTRYPPLQPANFNTLLTRNADLHQDLACADGQSGKQADYYPTLGRNCLLKDFAKNICNRADLLS